MNLPDFLLARIAELEAVARDAGAPLLGTSDIDQMLPHATTEIRDALLDIRNGERGPEWRRP